MTCFVVGHSSPVVPMSLKSMIFSGSVIFHTQKILTDLAIPQWMHIHIL